MKKIVFLINTLAIGGAEQALINLVNNLNPNKFEVTIVTLTNRVELKYKLKPTIKLIINGPITSSKSINRIVNKIAYLKNKYYSPLHMYKKFIKEAYDIEVAFLEGLPTKIISASNSKSKKIAWVHTNIDKNKDSDYFFKSNLEQQKAYENFNEIYCVSQPVKTAFIKRFRTTNRKIVMHNIIDENQILKLSTETFKPDFGKAFNIITVGRLTKQKGYVRLLNAYAKALKHIKQNTHLYIIGDGEEKPLLLETINSLGLNSNVTLLGSNNNPYKYILRADLYICGSFVEGLPTVVIEALILGKPVLTTKVANVKQLLNNGKFGLIVENNSDGLEYGIIKLIDNGSDLKEYKNNINKMFNNEYNNVDIIENQILKW